MKTKEELNALKEEVDTLNKKLAELNEDELKQVAGGLDLNLDFGKFCESDYDIVYKKDGVEVEDLTKPGNYIAVVT